MGEAEPGLVVVDVGNSRIKFGLVRRRPQLEATCAVAPDGDWSPVERLLDGVDAAALAWRVASVRRPSAEILLAWLAARGVRPAGAGEVSGAAPTAGAVHFAAFPDFAAWMPLRVDFPERVGVDRLCAAFAASQSMPGKPVAAVDCGTALTVNFVSADGAFLGGAIAPGLRTAARSLWTATDQLPEVPLPADAPPDPIGRNTTAAIQAGIFWQSAGLVRELLARVEGDPRLGGAVQLFVTGGGGRLLAAALGAEERYLPNLTLQGIALSAAS